MEEQTIQQSTDNQAASTEYDTASDGANYSGYDYDEDDDDMAMPEEDTQDYDYPPEDDELEPEGARLDADGNVRFGDNFFGDVHEKADTEPKYYTDEELRNTPYEQWDDKRLNGDISRFAPIVREQLQQRNEQARTQSRAQAIENIPMPQDIQEVKPYTPHELSDEAMRLACEKLGLEDPEDFDDYEADHRAAMQLAMNELMEKRNADVQNYQRGHAEWGQLQKFNAELSQRPDFSDFNQWYMGKLQQAGVTAEQVNNELYQYARQNGNRFSVIPQIIGTWYQEYQRERGSIGRRNYPQYDGASGNYPRYEAQTSRYPQYEAQSSRYPKRAAKPPVLESTRGNDYSGRRKVNLETFGDMDSDEQASALMSMGLV